MAKPRNHKRMKKGADMTTTATSPTPAAIRAQPEDPFVLISALTYRSLKASCRELGWIADGGVASDFSDRDLASQTRLEYKEKIKEVSERLTAYLAKDLVVRPPSVTDLTQAAKIAADTAKWTEANITVATVITAATNILTIYGKT